MTPIDQWLGTRPAPTDDQIADARAYVTEHAPDLLDTLFGGAS